VRLVYALHTALKTTEQHSGSISSESGSPGGRHWWHELNRYHWFVLVVAALGWLFDCLDQQLFNLARVPAMKELLRAGQDPQAYGAYATSIFLLGWATGGLAFGVLGDRIGRAKTMMWTILIYSLCTGLSALSTGFWDFAFYRFITGLGVGGEFAVGVALLAEVMPPRARPYALSVLQALSAVGNISAALIGMAFGKLEESGAIGSAWRWMFVIGAVPALLALVIRSRLKEPEIWRAAREKKEKLGSYKELFAHPRWRKNAFVGLALAFAGVVGLWGIVFFSIDLTRSVTSKIFAAQGLTPSEISGRTTFWAGVASMMLNIGAFFGMYVFGVVTQRIGRKPAFAITFILALISTASVFWFMDETNDVFWMFPVMGFCVLSLFAGYAIYFPELFPTYLRSTGTSFCYNVGRFVAASGPFLLGKLTMAYSGYPEPMRYAGITMCAVFLLGLCVLPFAPETRNQPLPEADRGFAH
jgi:MFS family permease